MPARSDGRGRGPRPSSVPGPVRVQPAAVAVAAVMLVVSLTDAVRGLGAAALTLPVQAAQPWQPFTWMLLAGGIQAVAVPVLLLFVGQLLEAQLGSGELVILLLLIGLTAAGAAAWTLPGVGALQGAGVLVPGLLACEVTEQVLHRSRQVALTALLLGLTLVLAWFSLFAWPPVLAAVTAGALASGLWHELAERGYRRVALVAWAVLGAAGYVAWALAG